MPGFDEFTCMVCGGMANDFCSVPVELVLLGVSVDREIPQLIHSENASKTVFIGMISIINEGSL